VVACATACVAVNGTRLIPANRTAVTSYPVNSEWSAEPETETSRHGSADNAEMTATACDWPLNVTWILRHYNNVIITALAWRLTRNYSVICFYKMHDKIFHFQIFTYFKKFLKYFKTPFNILWNFTTPFDTQKKTACSRPIIAVVVIAKLCKSATVLYCE